MVMQLTGVFLVGGSNHRRRQQLADQDSNRRPRTLRRLRYHSTGGCVIAISFPTAWSLPRENF